MSVVVGVLAETAQETRVAVVPEIASKLKAAGVRVLIERGAGTAAGAAASCPESRSCLKSSSAIRTSAMLCQRFSGAFRKHRETIRASSPGRPCPSADSGAGSAVRIAASVETVDSPWNARRPVSISYNSAPNEKMSER